MNEPEILDLHSNALDSLQHGLIHYIAFKKSESLRDIKQSVMNLVNSIDLLMLEKVRRTKGEDHIFENDKMDRFGLGYRKTISADAAYKLIKSDIDNLSDEEMKAYQILKILRNSATHSSFSYGEESEGNIVFLMHYIARFLDNELDEDIEELLDEDSFKFYHETIRNLDYGKVLQDRIDSAIEGTIHWLNFRSVKDGGFPVTTDWVCHECGREGVSLDEELAPVGECAYCGAKHNVGRCEVCEYFFDANWEGYVCKEDGFALCEIHSDADNFPD